ncbi:MAG: hypothetical protein PQ964_00745 [Methanobacteriaceae archaeon]|jgi:hypothetical protein
MLELIMGSVLLFVVLSFVLFLIEYYIFGQSIKESVEDGLFLGIIVTAITEIDLYRDDYQLIIIGVAGIAIFLLRFVFGYHMYKRSLKESIKKGLIGGIVLTIALLIVKLI